MSTPVAATVAPARTRREVVRFALTIFLSAYLLFQVQLIIAKFILPWFGGSAAVWTTCMLVFELLLLAGYGYAHALQKLSAGQEKIHAAVVIASLVLLVALATVWAAPILPGPSWKPHDVDHPVRQILKLLLAGIGLPFVVLSTTGPLLQRWFARGGGSPYRLYAISNIGSLLGLLAYPFVVEPALRLPVQAWMWCAGYLLFAGGVFLCAATRKGTGPVVPAVEEAATEKIGAPRVLAWILLPACASAMLLAATNLICQDVAVIAFLWVVPLCLYLLTFILCFDSPRWYRRSVFHPLYGIALFAAVVALVSSTAVPVVVQIVVHCGALFAVAMCCHGEVFRLRPAPRHLTGFYLAIAGGGALGGIFVALIAPRLFTGFWEYNVTILAAGVLVFLALMADRDSWLHRGYAWLAPLMVSAMLLVPYLRAITFDSVMAGWIRRHPLYYAALCVSLLLTLVVVLLTRDRPPDRRWSRVLQATVVLVLVVAAVQYGSQARQRMADDIARSRNFFGVLGVVYNGEHTAIGLRHGKTLHGFQYLDPARRLTPTLYYNPQSGIGRLLASRQAWPGRPIRVGVIGLGVGTLAAYAQPGDYLHYYEIDPDVLKYSNGPKPWFTFLRDCRGQVDVSLGDARLVLEQEAAAGQFGRFDVLVVDAFSSDSIPVHLLTREAIELYRRHLRGPRSVLAFHITNGTLDLRPVLLGFVQQEGLALKRIVTVDPPSDWILMSQEDAALETPAIASAPGAPMLDRPPVDWTDQYSNLISLVKWSSWGRR